MSGSDDMSDVQSHHQAVLVDSDSRRFVPSARRWATVARAAAAPPGRGDVMNPAPAPTASRPRRAVPSGLVTSLVVAALAALALVPATASSAAGSFVTRCGIRFCLDGRTYYFAGANTYDVFTYGGSYGDTETQYMDK